MKYILLFAAMFLVGCNPAPRPVANSNANAGVRNQPEREQTMIAHGAENPTPKPSGKWTQSGDPIDTSAYDTKIATAEKDLKAKPSSDEAKKALAQAYFERGFALTEARQYASALGDYRRALKQDPSHAESKKWMEQITSIYSMLKKEPPKEGEEPPPLPFKKEA